MKLGRERRNNVKYRDHKAERWEGDGKRKGFPYSLYRKGVVYNFCRMEKKSIVLQRLKKGGGYSKIKSRTSRTPGIEGGTCVGCSEVIEKSFWGTEKNHQFNLGALEDGKSYDFNPRGKKRESVLEGSDIPGTMTMDTGRDTAGGKESNIKTTRGGGGPWKEDDNWRNVLAAAEREEGKPLCKSGEKGDSQREGPMGGPKEGGVLKEDVGHNKEKRKRFFRRGGEENRRDVDISTMRGKS